MSTTKSTMNTTKLCTSINVRSHECRTLSTNSSKGYRLQSIIYYIVAIITIVVSSPAEGAIELSGRVLQQDSSGKSGVIIKLAGATLAATTDQNGFWKISDNGASIDRRIREKQVTSNISVIDGHLTLSIDGHDALGRKDLAHQNILVLKSTANQYIPRAMIAKPDTLVYSWNGKVILRDTISVLTQKEITRHFDTTVNAKITHGYAQDSEGHIYRTVKISSQVWFAENYKYKGKAADTIGVCYGFKTDSCRKYGRLYTWSEASKDVNYDQATMPNGVQGICPTGWHIPSDKEWDSLQTYIDADNLTDGIKLKSSSGWAITQNPNGSITNGNGTDDYGFRATPGGSSLGTSFNGAGRAAYFWSISRDYGTNYWCRTLSDGRAYMLRDFLTSSEGMSIRCIMNK